MLRKTVLFAMTASALSLGGCASSYAGEGALAGAAGGVVVGAATDGNVARGATIGAAAGGAVGALIRKNGRCYRSDRYGYQYEVNC